MSMILHANRNFQTNVEPPRGWPALLWSDFWTLVSTMSRQELIVFWLDSVVDRPAAEFNQWMKDLLPFTKNELLDIIPEVGIRAAERLVKESQTKKAVRKLHV